MNKVTYITGNQNKADLLAKISGMKIEHTKLDLDEIQSLDLEKVVGHKAKQAHGIVKSPVLVDDVSLGFNCLSGLPGPFIRWFVEETGLEKTCRLLDSFEDRNAVVEINYAYCDANNMKIFKARTNGSIADKPRGKGGFGFDPIFISEGYAKTWAECNIETYPALQMRKEAIKALVEYLSSFK